MKLLEALELVKQPISQPTSNQNILLECGFTPLHLKTFLSAHLHQLFPHSCIVIETGLYGDLLGNLERIQPAGAGVLCVIAEWPDLDSRLGIRSLGSWRVEDVPDIVESARRQEERLTRLITRLAENMPVYVSTPTLPLPPIFTTPGSHFHQEECKLRGITTSLATSLSACRQVRVMDIQRLDELSPLGQRFDPKADISSGFPYTLAHTSRVAELIATLIRDTPPKKGLITDLDDTLWAGILGEIGVEGVSWDMAGGGHMHGLYQRFLDSLASAGILLAIASKNDPSLVDKALGRSDLLLLRDRIFPLEVNWGPKSASVQRILNKWNIGPGDVVFVDDSPMEVAEVQTAFPQMTCMIFPKGDYHSIWTLLWQLRDQFGKTSVSTEDQIRLISIKSNAAFEDRLQTAGPDTDSFLRNAEATISFSLTHDARDRRAFELINKTNQFNLNGKRLSESEWLSVFRDPATFLLTASYEDKYGPLGKIAVIVGHRDSFRLHITAWVMSCRAFSRRIEHQCLRYLFNTLNVDEITLAYAATPRNGPLQSFLTELQGRPPVPDLSIQRGCIEKNAPALFHRILEVENA